MKNATLRFFLVALVLFSASFAYADKLAPPQNTLQPLPPDVQPAVSESVQRAATPQDIETIQNAPPSPQAPAPTVSQSGVSSGIPFAPPSSPFSIALWIALIAAALVAGGAVWFWKAFAD